MHVEICKWLNNAKAPVLFMVDDLANVWVDVNQDGKVNKDGDWGYAKDKESSVFTYLKENILKEFPNVKTTFFVPTGPRVGMILNPDIKSISTSIDNDLESILFYKNIHKNPMFEIAYHGTSHGMVKKKSEDFIQEWETYQSLEEAIDTINRGKKVHKNVLEEYPKGGKYCGYKSGAYGDQSVEKTDFLWWNRYYNRGVYENTNCDIGQDSNKISNYDIKFFGSNKVVDIPSTLSGDIFSINSDMFVKKIIKKLLKPYYYNKGKKEIDFLLENNLVISIQEHISPARDDGEKQTPNVIDDTGSLKKIFKLLKCKNVWYCTGTELAEYVVLRENIKISVKDNENFKIDFNDNLQRIKNNIISLKLDDSIKIIEQPNRKKITGENGVFNIEVLKGIYQIF